MQYYPLFVDLEGYNCLVVGAGKVAARKIRLLLKANAHITVIATDISDEVGAMEDSITRIERRSFEDSDIDAVTLVIVATDDKEINQHISQLARLRGLFVNVVDQPKLSSFITPAMIDRDPITVAISTDASAPVLARQLRSQIESILPKNYGNLAQLMSDLRTQVNNSIGTEVERKRFWEEVVEGEIAEKLFADDRLGAEQLLRNKLVSWDVSERVGDVALVGAGPGDPDLLTFRALRLLQRADVVLYDRLVSKEVLELARRDAEKIYVGKRRANHRFAQAEINQLLHDLAVAGNRVVRLKGGDPFLFGRGGEEIELLQAAGISFQIVPGISAANGCASYAGIPLTHRDHAHSCLFVTGHLKDGSVDLDWDMLMRPKQTVVIYMGLVGLPVICSSLLQRGLSADTPMALIEQGTTVNQRVFCATLSTIEATISDQNVRAPTLLILGSVVSLQTKFDWYGGDITNR